MMLERTEHFDEYGHSLGGRDTEYAYKKPSVLWTDLRGIKDFLPTSAKKSVRSAEFFNRSVRFITLLAIILAIAFRSWWPVLVGGGLFLLILLLSAGLESVARRSRAQGAVVGAAVATAAGGTENGSLAANNRRQASPLKNAAAGGGQTNGNNSTGNGNGKGNGNRANVDNASVSATGTKAQDIAAERANQSAVGVRSPSNTVASRGLTGAAAATRIAAARQEAVETRAAAVVDRGVDLSAPNGFDEATYLGASCDAMPCCGMECSKPLLDSMTPEQLRAANIRMRPKEPYPEPLSPFAQEMMERYREIAAQEEKRRAKAECTDRGVAVLERDDPYDPTATIPNPSRHNNWLQVDPRYEADTPLPYKHVRAQAVGYADDVQSDELRGSLMKKIMRDTNGKGPNGAGNTMTTMIGINPESASLSQVSSLYRRSSLHDNVGTIYAGANSCRPKAQQSTAGGGRGDARCNVVHDPTERMINDMYEDSTDRVWKQQFLDRRPPPWINPNDSQSRRAEEQSAADRQSWRGFSLHQGP